MIIEEISIKNFKSFGNNQQVLKLNTEKGELILLAGANGNGKSSLINTFEFSLYGKCRSRTKKWATLQSLPNRINGELLTGIKFKSNGTEVEVKRGLSPNIIELYENGILSDKSKSNIDDTIQQYVGMDIETFKSFLSLSINDFKNFISLSSDEKELLLDKLFNLEVITILKDILVDINKNNQIRMKSFDQEVSTLEDSINSIKSSISISLEKAKQNIQLEIDDLINEMNSKKDEYKQLKDKVEKIKLKENELNNDIENDKIQYNKTKNEIDNTQREIDLYDSGKCPTCRTDFNSDHFNHLKSTLIEKKESLQNIKTEIEDNIKSIKSKQLKLKQISDSTTTSFNDLNYLLKDYKSRIDKLKIKKENDINEESENIQEFKNTIKELKSKKDKGLKNIDECKEKQIYYSEINKILSEDGVKKSIISGIVKPINKFIDDNLKRIGLPFEVNMDDSFNVEIKQLGNVIDQDTISTGESKLISLCILISYLRLIKTKKNLNVLFLDEVFASIDLDNVPKILILLKSLAVDFNVNIFVVYHAVLDNENFDRILRMEKNIHSQIVEIKNNI